MNSDLEAYEKPVVEVVQFQFEESVATDLSGEGLLGSGLVCQMTEM